MVLLGFSKIGRRREDDGNPCCVLEGVDGVCAGSDKKNRGNAGRVVTGRTSSTSPWMTAPRCKPRFSRCLLSHFREKVVFPRSSDVEAPRDGQLMVVVEPDLVQKLTFAVPRGTLLRSTTNTPGRRSSTRCSLLLRDRDLPVGTQGPSGNVSQQLAVPHAIPLSFPESYDRQFHPFS